ncbi:MAG: hypothetical protein EA374_02890 [Acholeplasmatales bacterium]|nr:MAG: hypothetical protein EA374_02890 [Acholeplasmatales bacterium]
MKKRLSYVRLVAIFLGLFLVLTGCDPHVPEEPIAYTVTFLDADDQVIETVTVGLGEAAIAPEPPEKLDHTFTGWDTDFSQVLDALTVKPLYEPLTATGWRFNLGADSACITGYVGSETTVEIPDSLAGKTVTCIASDAFLSDATLQSVTVPNTVTTLGKDAFRDSAIVTVLFAADSQLTHIEDGAFRNARALSTVAFDPSSPLETLGADVFRLTTSLKTIDLPNAITTMGSHVFSHSGIETITLPEALSKIPDYAFNRTESLKTVTFHEHTTMERIGSNAFNSSAIETIHIPYTVTLLEEGAFYNTLQLETISFASNSRLMMIDEAAFSRSAIRTIALPKSLLVIGVGAFSRSSIESITLPVHVLSIGEGAFAHATALHTVILNNNLTIIDSFAFMNTPQLASVRIPLSVTGIGHHAFTGHDALILYVEANSKPETWSVDWHDGTATVIWGYRPI